MDGLVTIMIMTQHTSKKNLNSSVSISIPMKQFVNAGTIKDGLERPIIDLISAYAANGEWPVLEVNTPPEEEPNADSE
jgi:hypothetical protein